MMSGSLLILIPKKLCHGLSLGEEGWNGWRINARMLGEDKEHLAGIRQA